MSNNNQPTINQQSDNIRANDVMIPKTISKLKSSMLKFNVDMEERGLNGTDIVCEVAQRSENTVLHWTTRTENRTPLDLDVFVRVCLFALKDISAIEIFYKEVKELHQKLNGTK